MNIKVIAPAVIGILAAVSAGTWYFLSSSNDQHTQQQEETKTIAAPIIVDAIEQAEQEEVVADTVTSKTEETRSSKQEKTPVKEELPPLADIPSRLAESDAGVLQAAKNLAPKMVAWLTPDQQIRKWVFMVDNIAAGKIPSKNRPLSYDIDKFQVDATADEDTFYLSEENFHRAEQLIDVVVQLSPQELIRYYEHWLPLLNDAYDELGRSDSFQDRLLQAIDNILAVEPLNQKVLLKQPSVFYVYADKDLERTDKLNKFFWRLGLDNTKKVQTFLKNIEPLIN